MSRDELAIKLRRLAAFSGAVSDEEASRLLDNAWQIATQARVGAVFVHETT